MFSVHSANVGSGMDWAAYLGGGYYLDCRSAFDFRLSDTRNTLDKNNSAHSTEIALVRFQSSRAQAID
jgi:hypothetical protein